MGDGIERRAWVAAGAVVGVAIALLLVVQTRGAGLTPAIDEAIYVTWAFSDQTVGDMAGFLGPKILTVRLARAVAGFVDPGLAGFYVMKAVFALFAPVLVLAAFGWRLRAGDSPLEAFAVAAVIATMPVFMNGAGRVLSELPSTAFLALGILVTQAAENWLRDRGLKDVGAWAIAVGAVVLFFVAVGFRSTIFAAVGAFLGYRILAGLLERPDSGWSVRRCLANPAIPTAIGIGVLFTAVLAVWPMIFEFPHMPWGEAVAANLETFSRPPQSTVTAFFFSGGIWLVLAAAFAFVSVVFGQFRRTDLAEWAWLGAASSPYLAITVMRGEVLPRHIADLALPLALIVVLMARRVAAIPSVSPARIAIAAVGLVVILTAWWFGHRVGGGYASWFTHGALVPRRFAFWLVWAVFGGVAIVGILKLRPPVLLAAGVFLVIGLGHGYLALSAIRTDSCTISPQMMRSGFVEAAVDWDQDIVALPLVVYEAEVMQTLLPDWPLLTLDVLNELQPIGDVPDNGIIRWTAIPHHYLVDFPDLVEKMEAMAGDDAQARQVDQRGQVTFYRLEPAR